ncbi:oxidoreductase [Pusillimonas sp. TS35]|uniref:ferredoxin--NADP reductase n=1 Tax=Paracandidimonas lactea TaxID=2895524 RepID=UPI00137224EC|nr:FAD-dependent oxidoreductase [Paracandidimonas lactea]MYN13517.1 oxidoreductase [Pusillimonas sp. TS35]
MSAHIVKLLSRQDVADRTAAFAFEKPAGFHFKPGQAIDIILTGEGGPGTGERHTFSLISAPHEDSIAIATRMRDSTFKTALGALTPGAIVSVEGPSGSLTLPKDGQRPVVMLAGGIGITPFVSMLRHAAHVASSRPVILLYANRRPEDAAFLSELQAYEAELNGAMRLIATMTQPAASSARWTGRTGHIDLALIQDAANGLPAAPLYYLAGPPAMVEGMREMLEESGVDDGDIRSEEFFGY